MSDAVTAQVVDGGHAGDAAVVDVAVGVLLRREGAVAQAGGAGDASATEVLLASRPPGKVYAGWWEFPGGKFEPGEDALAALARELREELGIEVEDARPWRQSRVDYPHARVRLHLLLVHAWRGRPRPHEGQQLAWQRLPPAVAPLLAGTLPILAWLAEDGIAGPPPGCRPNG